MLSIYVDFHHNSGLFLTRFTQGHFYILYLCAYILIIKVKLGKKKITLVFFFFFNNNYSFYTPDDLVKIKKQGTSENALMGLRVGSPSLRLP